MQEKQNRPCAAPRGMLGSSVHPITPLFSATTCDHKFPSMGRASPVMSLPCLAIWCPAQHITFICPMGTLQCDLLLSNIVAGIALPCRCQASNTIRLRWVANSAPSSRTSSAARRPQRRVPRCPDTGWACWRWQRSRPWHGPFWDCHWIRRTTAVGTEPPMEDMLVDAPRTLPRAGQPLARPPMRRLQKASKGSTTALGVPGPTGHNIMQAAGAGRRKQNAKQRELLAYL